MFPMLQLNVNLLDQLSVIKLSNFYMDQVDKPDYCRLYSQDSFNFNSNIFKGLFISSFSTRSLNKNGWKFAPYIDGLNNKPDIIVLSETWFNETNINILPGYKAFSSIRPEKNGWWTLNFL